jgi:replication factor A1
MKTQNSEVFLFKIYGKVAAQFPVPEEILQGNNPIKQYIETTLVDTFPDKANLKKKRGIKDLKPGMKQVSLKARVLEVPEPRRVLTKIGSDAMVTNILIGDETGSIRLPLWNEQVNTVSKGDSVRIENAYVAKFRSEQQLRIGKRGGLRVIEDKDSLSRNNVN